MVYCICNEYSQRCKSNCWRCSFFVIQIQRSDLFACNQKRRNHFHLYDGLWDGPGHVLVQRPVESGLAGPLVPSSPSQYAPGVLGGSARGLFHRQSLGFPAGPEILAPEKDVSHRHGDRYALVDGSHDDYADPFPVPPHHISPDPFPGLSPQLFVCLAAPAAPGRASGPFPFPPADSCRKVSERRL